MNTLETAALNPGWKTARFGAGGLRLEEIVMDKCSPVEMRKCLEVVQVLKEAGIRFVPMPVIDDDDRQKLLRQLGLRLRKFEKLLSNDEVSS